MPVRWKVVNQNRNSCVIRPSSKYHTHYLKGKIVTARKETIGLLVFKRKKDAVVFLQNDKISFNDDNPQIIKVMGIGRGEKPKFGFHFHELAWGYTKISSQNFSLSFIRKKFPFHPPKGTLCYRKVKVIT